MEAQFLMRTPLHAAHAALHARFTAFAGYNLPLQYDNGVLAEHRWTRAHAGLFDVSHMGVAILAPKRVSGDPLADHLAVASALETLVPSDLRGLPNGRQRYTMLLNASGGVIDDLMVVRAGPPSLLYVVVNAAAKARNFGLIRRGLAGVASLTPVMDHTLLSLQGPEAAAALGLVLPQAVKLAFMDAAFLRFGPAQLLVSRSGYTGEDGFELLAPAAVAGALWAQLLDDPRIKPIGLGARDTLLLEAALPLYGDDLDESVSPVEAGLKFVLSRRRLEAGDFPGSARIKRELAKGPGRLRIGLRVQGAPARKGAQIIADGEVVGHVTSGGFSPSLGAPIAMGFVRPDLAEPGVQLSVIVREHAQPATVAPLPFLPSRYVRKP